MNNPQKDVADMVPILAEVRNNPFAKSGASGAECDNQYWVIFALIPPSTPLSPFILI